MLKVSQHYKAFFIFSTILVLISLTLFFVWGVRLGIDFRGGALMELKFNEPVIVEKLATALDESGLAEFVIQPTEDNRVLIKMQTITPETQIALKDLIRQTVGEFEELRFESIGPTIGKELLQRAYWQIVLVVIGIIFYIAYAFRKIKKITKHQAITSWRLGFATIVALIHDLIITLGVFVILGRFFSVEIDSLFITALLTILGFSVHDSIVVFDRIRENLQKYPQKNLKVIIDYSISSTLARSINTSSTLLFVLLALLLFGGQTIYYFVLALLIGVITGTYSSIFIASPILYLWRKGD